MVSHPTDPDVYWTAGRGQSGSQYVIQASRTDDAGSSWTRYILGSGYGDAYHMAIDQSDPQRVYVAGYESSAAALYRTDDGGSTWSGPSATGLAGYVYDLAIDPTDPSTIYAATAQGVYRSDDYGSAWSQLRTGATNAVCVDPDEHTTVYAGTASGGVYASWDGGSSWEEFNEGLTENEIGCLADVPGQYIFAGTEGGASFRWSEAGTEEAGSAPVSPFGLTVGPNPCASAATISWSLPAPREAEVSVYDAAGRLVERLHSGTAAAGSHTTGWNASGSPRGMYIVLVQTGTEAEAAKLVVTE
jgi:photosystem II stability/assembly factor-like uncharacterized protein